MSYLDKKTMKNFLLFVLLLFHINFTSAETIYMRQPSNSSQRNGSQNFPFVSFEEIDFTKVLQNPDISFLSNISCNAIIQTNYGMVLR